MNTSVSYYPGCSLHGMAEEYHQSVLAACESLDIAVEELPDWSCCGATSAHLLDPELAIKLAVRNLALAEAQERDLLVPCAACFSRLKHAAYEVRADGQRWGMPSYQAKAALFHVNEFFDRPEILKAIKQRVKRPLLGLCGVPYYGCLSSRPPKVTGHPSPENPESMDRVLAAIGMDVIAWSYKTDCCGASFALTRTDIVRNLTGKLYQAASEAGAQCIVTDCPICQSNLDTRQAEIEKEMGKSFSMPVFYLTELIALALGDARAAKWWNKHFVSPIPLLRERNLL